MSILFKRDLVSKNEYFIYFYWAFDLIVRRFTSIASSVFGVHAYVEIINAVVWGAVILYCLDVFLLKIKINDFFLSFIVIFFSFAAHSIWSFNDLIISNRPVFLLTIFPYYFLGRIFVINDNILKNMGRISRMVLVINIPIYFLIYRHRVGSLVSTDNMGFAYQLLPHILLLLYIALKVHKLSNWFWFLTGTVLLTMQGTRGPLLLIVLFYIWYCIQNRSAVQNSLIALASGTILILLFEMNLFKLILNVMIRVFSAVGISTRVFELLLISNSVDALTGRNIVQSRIMEAINTNSKYGLGPYGDIFITRNTSISAEGMYAHNFFLELMCHYGIVIGIIAGVLLFLLATAAYFSLKTELERFFMAILLCCSLVKFLFSGSYLLEPSMYVLVGYSVTALSQQLKNRRMIMYIRRKT